MPVEQIGDYVVEYSGERIRYGNGWIAYLAVYAPSPNPAHRNCVMPRRRVRLDTVFQTREAAEESTREFAIIELAQVGTGT